MPFGESMRRDPGVRADDDDTNDDRELARGPGRKLLRMASDAENRPRRVRAHHNNNGGGVETSDLTMADAADRLQMLICKLSERGQVGIERDIRGVTNVVLVTIDSSMDRMIDLILTCTKLIPHKVTIYTALVALTDDKRADFGTQLVSVLARDLAKTFDAGQEDLYESFRFLLRFLFDLVNVNLVDSDSLSSLILDMLDSCALASGDPGDLEVNRRTDFIVYCILSNLPWCGRTLSEKNHRELKQILHICSEYVKSPRRTKNYCGFVQVWRFADPHAQEEYLDCIMKQIDNLEIDDWKEAIIDRVYESFPECQKASIPRKIPSVRLSPFCASKTYPLPRCVFRLFDYTDVPDEFNLPGVNSIERFLIEETISNIIQTHHLERVDCIQNMMLLQIYGNVPLDYMIVEVIFGQMLQLPKSNHIHLVYCTLLLELCRLVPDKFPEILAQTTELVFDRLTSMRNGCKERFIDWFAYNLSNFQLRWTWSFWAYIFKEIPNAMVDDPSAELDIEVDEMGMTVSAVSKATYIPDKSKYYLKVQFLIGVMDKLARLVYHTNVEAATPAPFHCIIPRSGYFFYKYNPRTRDPLLPREQDELINDPALLALSENVRIAVLERMSGEQIQQTLSAYSVKQFPDQNFSTAVRRVDVLTTVLIWSGSKTISHVVSLLNRYQTLLTMFITDDDHCEIACIRAVYEVCRESVSTLKFIIGRLISLKLIKVQNLIKFVFGLDLMELEKKFIWELVHDAFEIQNSIIKELETNGAKADSDREKANLSKLIDEAKQNLKQSILTLCQLMVNTVAIARDLDQANDQIEESSAYRQQYLIDQFHAVLCNNHKSVQKLIPEIKDQIDVEKTHFPIVDLLNQFFALFDDHTRILQNIEPDDDQKQVVPMDIE